jgi:pimeloyl-ACP methyl ester carboxylesterase
MENVGQFREIAQPVDLLYGEHTFQAVKDSIETWMGIFPKANAYQLKGAGHLPIEEATEQLANILFSINKDK